MKPPLWKRLLVIPIGLPLAIYEGLALGSQHTKALPSLPTVTSDVLAVEKNPLAHALSLAFWTWLTVHFGFNVA